MNSSKKLTLKIVVLAIVGCTLFSPLANAMHSENKVQKPKNAQRILGQPLNKYDLSNAQWNPIQVDFKTPIKRFEIVGFDNGNGKVYAEVYSIIKRHTGGYDLTLIKNEGASATDERIHFDKIAKLPLEQKELEPAGSFASQVYPNAADAKASAERSETNAERERREHAAKKAEGEFEERFGSKEKAEGEDEPVEPAAEPLAEAASQAPIEQAAEPLAGQSGPPGGLALENN